MTGLVIFIGLSILKLWTPEKMMKYELGVEAPAQQRLGPDQLFFGGLVS